MERAVAVNSDNEHLWTQFVLCLLCGGKEPQAFTVIQQILEVNPKNVMMLLFGAKICINHLGNISKAAEYCNSAIQICNNEPRKAQFLGRAYHYFGVCFSALALEIYSIDRKKIHEKSLENFQQASISGCMDYLFLFHYALEHAETRNIVEAKKFLNRSLALNRDYAPSWILLILLLTSQKLYEEAFQVCATAMDQVEDIRLYYCSAQIDIHLKRYTKAMITLHSLCALFADQERNSVVDTSTHSDVGPSGLFSPRRPTFNDDLSESRTNASQMSDSCSIKTAECGVPKRQPVGVYDCWILLSQAFLELGQHEDCSTCLDNAEKARPFHPNTFYHRGKLAEALGKKGTAIRLYKEGLGCDSNNELCTLQLAKLFMDTDVHQAENYATIAVRKFPFSAEGWFLLGQVLLKFEDSQAATSCMKLSLELEQTTPLIPFSWIKREL